MKAFKAKNNGFWINFPNGYSLSTQFGYCNYGDNYDIGDFEKNADADEVEVGILKNNSLVMTPFNDGDTVIGYVNQKKWLEIFDWVRSQKSEDGHGK